MAASIFDKILPMAKAAGPRLKAALPTLGGIALLVAAGAWIYAEFFGKPPETYGQLVVDSPEIYTRERLVNDRFVEDAWLRRKLRASDTADFKPAAGVARRDSSAMRVSSGADATDAAGAPAVPRDVARRDAQALFRSELTYRSDIRNLIIENQLDDRHDLRGNSLFRLKFDASVLPGDNTRANAQINVTLAEPPHQPLGEKDLFFTAFNRNELKRWRLLFSDWLRDTGDNINRVVADLKYDYATHRFSPEYLGEILATMDQCDKDDSKPYDARTIRSLLEGIGADPTADPRPVLQEVYGHIEDMRETLVGCAVSKTIETVKGERTTPVRTAGQDQPEPAAGPETTEDAKAQDAAPADGATGTDTGSRRPRRRNIKVESSRAGSVSLNELIHRFAAPRLFQLTFGRGAAGGKAWGSLGVWKFFAPYATLTAIYSNDDDAFQLRANKTTLVARRADEQSDLPCAEKSASLRWREDRGFCLSAAPEDIETFLSSVDLTSAEIPDILAGDPDSAGKLDRLIAGDEEEVPIVVESGLFAFIRHLQRSSSVFSYAVTPKQAVQALAVDEQSSRQAAVAAAANGLGGQLGGDRSIGFNGVLEQPLVVGYGNALGGRRGQRDDSARIEFGWFISPPVQGVDGAGLQRIHPAAQYALTALVSVPAWWDKIDLKVERAWVAQDGSEIPVKGVTEDAVVTIDLPRDLESINASLFNRAAGPEIEERKMEPIAVTVCRPAAILLPGRRLWRSAVVTLGSQPADEIQVLPNMRGIIAKFDQVQMPPGDEVPVTVWTSEGSRTLRNRAVIKVPSFTDAGLARDSVLYPNGTCRPEPNRDARGDQQAQAE